MYGYIYLTENLINGKCYIGQHRATEFDESYKGSGVQLKKAFKKYGKDNFIVTAIEWCENEEQLNNREDYWIEKCDASNSKYFYNICTGAYGHPMTEEIKRKIGEANKVSLNGHVVSLETREKIGNSQRGTKHNYSGGWKGKHLPEEMREKMSNSHKGKPSHRKGKKLSKEHRENIAKNHKGNKGMKWKLVDGKRYYYND